jgi:hypothetical protein
MSFFFASFFHPSELELNQHFSQKDLAALNAHVCSVLPHLCCLASRLLLLLLLLLLTS